MIERGEEAPPIGARMQFVILHDPMKDKIAQRAESLEYALAQGLQLDLKYYIENLVNPLSKIT